MAATTKGAEVRCELILRVRDLTPEQAEAMARVLAPLATGRSTLSRIDRERHVGHEIHLGRKALA